ncbi:hypothetical protein WA026_016631 [Henosepilachna vigintioctopunctata]|uniref:Uncharacterized protein n=1 Tax=Henosepilachna vigintioctopunctata TaxID=420089 RepID=A0AAW1VFR1_9CUCU
MLLEKLLSEMEYTISVQKKLITSYEAKLELNLLDNKISKQSDSGDTPADKNDKISSIDPLIQKQSFAKSGSGKKIAVTETNDLTSSSNARANLSYADFCNRMSF